MSSGKRDVLFFGSVSASIVGYQVQREEEARKLENVNSFVTLRSVVRTPNAQVEEAIGAVSQTWPFEMAEGVSSESGVASLRRQRALFHPVMIELAHDAAAAMAGGGSGSDDDDDGDGADGANAGGRTVDLADEGQCGHLSVAVELYMDLTRSGAPVATVAKKRIILRNVQRQSGKDICTIAKVPLFAAALDATDDDSLTRAQAQAADADAIVTFFVLLRVIDLSEKVFIAQQAEDGMRRFLGLERPIPYMNLCMQRRTPAPYGSMPVTELYRHYCHYYSRHYSRALRQSAEVVRALADGCGPSEECYPHRWNTLVSMSLRTVLLGEEGVTPLLATLAHCSNLRELEADQNALGDLTCARLAALFARHRYLATLSVTNNNFYEAGADALLRLARRNRRITALRISGNGCSDTLQKRLQALVDESKYVIRNDPLNVLAPPYGYLASPTALPQRTLMSALNVWAMLCATPVGDIDVWTRNSTTRSLDAYVDESVPRRQQAAEAAAASPPSAIPAAARAPLLNEIMRTVSVGVNRVVADAVVRSVFMDVEASSADWRERVRRQAEERDDADVANAVGELPAELASAFRENKRATVMTEEELYAASFLRIIVTTMRGLAHGADWDADVAPLLSDLGLYQRELGVMEEDYWLASHIFIKALQVCCGTEENASDRLGAFLLVMALGIRTAVGPTKVF